MGYNGCVLVSNTCTLHACTCTYIQIIILSGRYMFIEASAPRKEGQKARLLSPWYQPQFYTKGACLTFWYHMYGTDIGRLNVYIDRNQPKSVSPTSLTSFYISVMNL